LWEAIRRHQLGIQIRRQVPIGRFVVDFLVPEARVVLEVDGPYHSQRRAADARRDAWLGRAGYRVLRLEAALVEHQLPLAIERIHAELVAARCSAR
jgi:very-short-patch-repair endonuclease